MMGDLPTKFTRQEILDCLESNYNMIFVYIDAVCRFIFGGWLGNWYNEIELFFMEMTYKMSKDKDEEGMDKFCVDQDGIQFKGDTWQNKNQCNFKKCVAHDCIKELRCPEIPEKEGCTIQKGDTRDPYPKCCDSAVCKKNVTKPMVERPAPIWYRDENYIHFFE